MAIRNIRINDDEILRKKCRNVEKVDLRILRLLDDMRDTMYKANGVGIAGPQVGILKKVVVIDVGDGPIYLINPEIIETQGSYVDEEGCLSLPGKTALVERPQKVKVEYVNEKDEKAEITGENLLARALCHEIDHLSGIMFIDKAIEEE